MKENNRYPNFLVIGLERSGTHWVAALLNAHPQIACFPSQYWYEELGKNKIGSVHFFDTLAGLEGKSQFTRDFNDFSYKYNEVFKDLVPLKETLPKEELYEKFVEKYSEYCKTLKGDKEIVGESSTGYVFVLPFIDKLYPGIKKICTIRDPKDRIVSWHFNQVRKGRKKEGKEITEAFAMEYLTNKIIPEYEKLMAYTGEILCVSYEALHNSPQKEIEKILVHLGFSPALLEMQTMIQEASFERQTKQEGETERRKGEEDYMSGLRKGIAGDWNNYINKELALKIDETIRPYTNKLFDKYDIER